MPLRTARSVLRTLARAALTVSLLGQAHATQAAGPYPWPVDGAPLCIASGNQHRLFGPASGCNVLTVSWIHSLPGSDSLASGFVNYLPPNGSCPTWPPMVGATGVTETSATEVRTNLIAIGIPGCLGPPPVAQVWLQGSGSASQLLVHNDVWLLEHQLVTVDDGDFVRQHPRASGSANTLPDTALVVVWSDERTGVPQIRAQRVDWSGAREWGASGVLIAPTGVAQTAPEVTRLQDGSTLVMWVDARSGGGDVYALRLLLDGTPAPGWPATGLALEDRPEVSASPRFVGSSTFNGAAFVVWEESGPRFGGGRSIVARRLLADGTPDPAWSPLGVVLASTATVDHLQDAVWTGSDLVAVWTDTRAASPANPTDLYAQWLENSGALASGWPASGLAICTAPGSQGAARVSATPSYAAFAWEDRRGADADVYAALRYADGTLPPGLWVADGLAATLAAGDQSAPVVGAGNGGGCFVAWEDGRDLATSGLDIYAQAFSGEGEKLDAPRPGTGPAAFLGAPRPNPMRSSATFTLELPRAGTLRVEVFDLAGRRLRVLAAGEVPAGARELVFDGRDDAGRELPPGLYRVLARVDDTTASRVVIRIR